MRTCSHSNRLIHNLACKSSISLLTHIVLKRILLMSLTNKGDQSMSKAITVEPEEVKPTKAPTSKSRKKLSTSAQETLRGRTENPLDEQLDRLALESPIGVLAEAYRL